MIDLIYCICFYILFVLVDYFLIKFEIWHNKDLFYDLHYKHISKELQQIAYKEIQKQKD